MGVSFEDIDNIVHWGPPSDILQYWQEVGRCARDGRDGKAILYTPPYSVNQDRLDAAMLDFVNVKSSNCHQILTFLKLEGTKDKDIDNCCQGATCCSVCDSKKILRPVQTVSSYVKKKNDIFEKILQYIVNYCTGGIDIL